VCGAPGNGRARHSLLDRLPRGAGERTGKEAAVQLAHPGATDHWRGPVVFVDKDGTLIEDVPYNVDPAFVRFAPGARAAVRLLAERRIPVAVITNQSGVARGLFPASSLEKLASHLGHEVEAMGGRWAGFYACPHHPAGVNAYAGTCACRKPEPGLLLQAAADLGVDIRTCWFIGDQPSDVEAGRRAGCRTALIRSNAADAAPPGSAQPDVTALDLLGAVEQIADHIAHAPTHPTAAVA
jgi:D-glycero-D-manno-heptose 1,7-bisphosphate phosphatase